MLEEGTDEFGAFGHGWTYSAHPIGAAAGVANLKLIDDLGLIENNRTVGAHLRAGLTERLADHPNVGDIRGVGMLAAVEFVANKSARRFFDPAAGVGAKVSAALAAKAVIARAMPQGDILGFAPPFCLTIEEAETVVDRTAEAVFETFA